jgi:hypothetical protein
VAQKGHLILSRALGDENGDFGKDGLIAILEVSDFGHAPLCGRDMS